jgi:hypothetical protein
LSPSERSKALDLVAKFKELGAGDPEGWARSEVGEDIAQLARFLFLRSIWSSLIDGWARDPQTWTKRFADEAVRQPNGHFADAGLALGRLLAAGASPSDIGSIARMVAYETAFGVIDHVDEGHDPDTGMDGPYWVLIETDGDGTPTGRQVAALHEDLLTMDPSGREGRPS